MKTVIAALALSIPALAPATTETNPALRGTVKTVEVSAETKVEAAPPRTDAVSAKKVRVVLASLYGD